jgi:hypothetical protein
MLQEETDPTEPVLREDGFSQKVTKTTKGLPHRREGFYTPRQALGARSKFKLKPGDKTHCVSLLAFFFFNLSRRPTFSLRSNAATPTHSRVICLIAALESQAESVDRCPSSLSLLPSVKKQSVGLHLRSDRILPEQTEPSDRRRNAPHQLFSLSAFQPLVSAEALICDPTGIAPPPGDISTLRTPQTSCRD